MKFSNVMLGVKAFAPEILIGTGIATGVMALVATGKGSVKANNILAQAKIDSENASEEDAKKIKSTAIKNVAKCYIPTVIFTTATASCMISSFHIQKGRELAMAGAYVALKESFDNYKARVENKIGEEENHKLLSGEKTKTTVIGHAADGTEIAKTEIEGYDAANCFKYLFDESNPNWQTDARENYYYLWNVQQGLNEVLKARGHVFLYEVYNRLHIDNGILGPERIRLAHILGWIYDPDKPNGANYIDFGIFKDSLGNLKPYNQAIKDEPNIWLEFNPDGDILLGTHGQRVFTEERKK